MPSVLLDGRVDVRAILVELPLVDVRPRVVPRPAPVVTTEDATDDNERVVPWRALEKGLVESQRVERLEEPIHRVLALSRVLAPVLNPLRIVVPDGSKTASATPRPNHGAKDARSHQHGHRNKRERAKGFCVPLERRAATTRGCHTRAIKGGREKSGRRIGVESKGRNKKKQILKEAGCSINRLIVANATVCLSHRLNHRRYNFKRKSCLQTCGATYSRAREAVPHVSRCFEEDSRISNERLLQERVCERGWVHLRRGFLDLRGPGKFF